MHLGSTASKTYAPRQKRIEAALIQTLPAIAAPYDCSLFPLTDDVSYKVAWAGGVQVDKNDVHGGRHGGHD